MRTAWLAVFVACLGRAVGGLANAGASDDKGATVTASTSHTSALQNCVSVSLVTETSALKTLTATLTVHANHTRYNTTRVKNGTRARSSAHDTGGHASLSTSTLKTSSSEALVCPSNSGSAACPCYSIARSTTTVTVPKTTITSTTTSFINGTHLPWHPTSRTRTATGISSASREAVSSDTSASSSFLVTGNSAGAPFLDTSTAVGASRKPSVVYVVNSTTTLITITTSSKASASILTIPSSDTTTGRYIHPLSTQSNSSLTSRPPFPRNSTTTKLFTNATSSAAPLNTSLPSLLTSNTTTRPVWLNTSSAPPTRITNKPWLNFSTFPSARINTTLPTWLNTSLPRTNITTAPPRWLNTSTSSATPTPTPTSSATPNCASLTSSGFNLQISQPGGTFNNWFLRVSGIGLLFTSQSGQASAFGLGGAGELCALGLVDGEGVPYVAVVESRNVTTSGAAASSVGVGSVGVGGGVVGGVGETGSGSGGNGGSVWLVARSTLQALRDDYTALGCERGGAGLSCRGEDGEARDAQYWMGCGMQLDLSSDPSGEGPARGLNCSAVGLGVVQSS